MAKPKNPNGLYIRKDGITNPENFTDHRKSMIRFSEIAGTTASAYLVTKKNTYAQILVPHLKAWFLGKSTRMNPNLMYGQAIMDQVTGRGIGVIDTIHLLEVVKAVIAIEDSGALSQVEIFGIKDWFSVYLEWMTTHEYGIKERDNGSKWLISQRITTNQTLQVFIV